MIIAVDFDGTCVEHAYPDVGEDVPHAENVLRRLVLEDHKLILWTMRSGDRLVDAEKWFEQRDIPLFGVNDSPGQRAWTDSPKQYAHLYIDDAALGCPLIYDAADRPYVDWEEVHSQLINLGVITLSHG